MTPDLLEAIDAALAGDWQRAHEIAQQDEDDPFACWVHAVLHKMEGDTGNSRYWYARTAHSYGEFADPQKELTAIKNELQDHIKGSEWFNFEQRAGDTLMTAPRSALLKIKSLRTPFHSCF